MNHERQWKLFYTSRPNTNGEIQWYISTDGFLKKAPKNKEARIFTGYQTSVRPAGEKSKGTKGYLALSFNHPEKYIHRLVALNFIPNPEGKPIVDHIDGNTWNNDVSNLRWCTYSENNQRRHYH